MAGKASRRWCGQFKAWLQWLVPDGLDCLPGRGRGTLFLEQLEPRVLLSTFVVNSLLDLGDSTPSDGIADTTNNPTADPPVGPSGITTLRAALQQATADGGGTIRFAIGSGHQIISTPHLPTSGSNIIIDGTSQPGYAGVPLIEIRGTGANQDGLQLFSNNVIKGLIINSFGGDGIVLLGDNNLVINNYVGTDHTGTVAMGNFTGIEVVGGDNNVIGGIATRDRNLVSGNNWMGIDIENGHNNIIRGNYVGTDVTGMLALPNEDGVHIHTGSGNIIGVDASGRGPNLISGNELNGVRIHGANTLNNTVQGNLIGTQINGTAALPNQSNGVHLESRNQGGWESVINNTIGGSGAFARNLISGNGAAGILISGEGASGNTVIFNYIGTDDEGENDLGNDESGIVIFGAPNNTIGGERTAPAQLGNLISGNGASGVQIFGNAATGNTVIGNNIGTDITGRLAVGNAVDGVLLESEAGNNIIGGELNSSLTLGNLISGNFGNGVRIIDDGTAGNLIQGNYIGVARDGKSKLGNGSDGVEIASAPNNAVGGVLAGNIISGNSGSGVLIWGSMATGNVVEGNRIGISATGVTAVGNSQNGVRISNSAWANVIGGEGAGEGNVIVASEGDGVWIGTAAHDNVLAGNFIGTDANDAAGLGNKKSGVTIDGDGDPTTGNTIGGTTAEARNVISGNLENGVAISGAEAASNTVAGNYIGVKATGSVRLSNQMHGVFIEDAGGNTIGGSAPDGGNVISGNTLDGIFITGNIETANLIRGNSIGVNAAGSAALGNRNGIKIEVDGTSVNTIGGLTDGYRNVISGNRENGIFVLGTAADTTATILIQGNFIGSDEAGTLDLGNGESGIRLQNVADTTIGGSAEGAGNTIAFNEENGVLVDDSAAPGASTGNLISRNSIFGNLGLGIKLTNTAPGDISRLLTNDNDDSDVGANNLQNYPEIFKTVRSGGSITVDGFLRSTPATNFTLEFFSNTFSADTGSGESKTYVGGGTLATDADGYLGFTYTVPLAANDFLSLTATDPDNNTSEISQDRDGDGLFDSWEEDDMDVDGDGTVDLSLQALGANPDYKDLFVEADYMASAQPLAASLSAVVAAFAAAPVVNPNGRAGINMHTGVGESMPTEATLAFNTNYFTLKGQFFGTAADRSHANSANILAAKRQVYRYSIFGMAQPGTGSSGRAEINTTTMMGGNDFMVTVGAWSAAGITSSGGQQAVEAGTFMHELGHTLGLGHGGGDHSNYKPNYLSIMSYSYQFPSLDPARPLDYSRQQLLPLNENSLNEFLGVPGPGGRRLIYRQAGVRKITFTHVPIDYNGVGGLEAVATGDLNNDGVFEVLNSFDDWGSIQYNFHGSNGLVDGSAPGEEEINDLTEEVVVAQAGEVDFDGDHINNAQDNAPGIFNPNQAARNGVAEVISKKSATFVDEDGDIVTVTLKGAGMFALVVDDEDGDLDGSIAAISLLDTNQTSSLTITVKKVTGGNGQVNVGGIAGGQLKSITASPANIVAGGIGFTGYVGSVTVRDILEGADVELGGSATQATTFTARDIGDDSAIASSAAFKSFTALRVGAGSLIAPSLVKLTIKGDTRAAIAGTLAADITLSGSGVAAKKPTLGGAAIAGTITSGVWNITGNSGAITALAIASDWEATFSGNVLKIQTKADASGQFTAATLGSLAVGDELDGASYTLTLGLPAANSKALSLGAVTVKTAIRDSTIRSAGNVKSVTAGGMFDSSVFAGVLDDATRGRSGLPLDRSEFLDVLDNLLPTISAFTISGLAGQTTSFGSANVAAWKLGKVTLKDVQVDTPDDEELFGLAASAMQSYLRKSGAATAYKWPNPASPTWPDDSLGYFVLRALS